MVGQDKMSIRTLIVDDEPLARQGIRLLLQNEPDLVVLGECANGAEALKLLESERPELMFLDVQMPEMDGFSLLAALPADKRPVVIFVTAYDRHAVQAFEVAAIDYLLKPLKPARFREALQRARQQLQSRDTSTLNQRLQDLLELAGPGSDYPRQLAVKTGDRTVFVRVSEIDYVEGAANYVILHVGPTNHMLRETLTNLETRLSPKIFLRIHRSFIVNMARISGVKPALRGEHVVALKNGKELPMTRGVRELQGRLEFL
jgi:two-component system, LytTR family, response regulator